MHNDPNDRLSKEFQKQPADAATKPRGDRTEAGDLKIGEINQEDTHEDCASKKPCSEESKES